MNTQLTVNVDKDRLLATLKANRENHGAAYERAKAGYITVTTKQVESYLTRLANGELLERAFIPPPPEDHTSEYDSAIQMMEWSSDTTIELTQAQFAQYVQDDWGWRQQWLASNSTYLEAQASPR
jgi:hypothetical protein